MGQLAEPGEKEEAAARALFEDLVRLVNCEPLPPLDSASPARLLRSLVRVERSRRVRLGASAARSDTVWRDILNPAFFNRTLGDLDRTLLVWPVEAERWSNEAIRAKVRPSACEKPPAAEPGELAIATAALVRELDKAASEDAQLRGALARVAYHRAALLLARGDAEGAREAAASLPLDTLASTPLAPFARLLRLEVGLDPASGYLALLDAPLGDALAAVRLRAARELHVQGGWEPLLQVTAEIDRVPPPELCARPARNARQLLYRRAAALDRLDRAADFDALIDRAFPACAALDEPEVQALRSLALRRYARLPFEEVAARVTKLAAPGTSARLLWQLGANALHGGNLPAAEATSARLRGAKELAARTRGWSLAAEIAFWKQDAAQLESAVKNLFPDDGFVYAGRRERDERDRAALEFAEAVVIAADDVATQPFRARLRIQLTAMKERASLKREAAFDALIAALDGKPPSNAEPRKKAPPSVAVGEVPVDPPGVVLEVPPLQIDWPEPQSLLAIPAPAGAPQLWAWFTGRGPEVAHETP